MAKVKILKKLPKSKKKYNKKPALNNPQANKYTEDYLRFYDDIKLPSKRYDW